MRKQDFEAAVVDLKMEDMDGLEVLKIFKKMVPALPVIMLTGHGSETAAREGIKLGAFDYLTKPCDLEELLDEAQQVVVSPEQRCGSERAVGESGQRGAPRFGTGGRAVREGCEHILHLQMI